MTHHIKSIISLILLFLIAIFGVNFSALAQKTGFFQSMELGEYTCNPNLCEISDKKVIWLDERVNYRHMMFVLPSVTGFVENITLKNDHIYEVNINWDDGSGESNREIIHVESLSSSLFLMADSHGQRNLMVFTSAN